MNRFIYILAYYPEGSNLLSFKHWVIKDESIKSVNSAYAFGMHRYDDKLKGKGKLVNNHVIEIKHKKK